MAARDGARRHTHRSRRRLRAHHPRDLRRLIAEGDTLFGGRHFGSYHFLVALSDRTTHFGLEHHESSDNRLPARAFLDADRRTLWARLLPHEFAHSWNGKFRRPAQQTLADYQQPRQTDLLWVYEGLTAYLGNVLAVRSGLWPADLLRARWADYAGALDAERGRSWRALEDTAISARVLYNAPTEWSSWRRAADFHPEGELLWLEVDAIIRERTGGRRSIDDFCRRFFGGIGAPTVSPYREAEITSALNDVCPWDWEGFFARRVRTVCGDGPAAGIERAGWRVAYGAEPNAWGALLARIGGESDLQPSVGARLDDDGTVLDVSPGSDAERAGLVPGARIVAVDRRAFSTERLLAALRRARPSTSSIDLLVVSDGWYEDRHLAAPRGLRYPRLERSAASPDFLAAVFAPHASAKGTDRLMSNHSASGSAPLRAHQ